MKKIAAVILSLLLLFIPITQIVYAEPDQNTDTLSLSARSAILVEQSTGTVLFDKNCDEKLPIASVTKIMTLLLTVEAIDSGVLSLDDKVSVSEAAAGMGGSQMYLEVGEQISVSDLLKAVFVASCNDGAVALAEHLAGSVEAFVARMNTRASELGMGSAEFHNPTGLDDTDTNLVSARDVAKMSCALLKHDIIYNYTKIWTDSVRGGAFGLANTNKLIRFYSGATGLKTGSTAKAKYCLSASAERNGLKLCAVVLGSESSADRFADAKKLLDYGFASWSFYTPDALPPTSLKVWGGTESEVSLHSEVSGMLLEKSVSVGITSRIELADSINAPVDANQTVGKIVYEKGGSVVAEVPILTDSAVPERSFFDIFIDILRLIFLKSV